MEDCVYGGTIERERENRKGLWQGNGFATLIIGVPNFFN